MRLGPTIAGLAVITLQAQAAAAGTPVRIGQTRSFGPNDIGMVGAINGALNQKLGGENMTFGGTDKRLSKDVSLICGYYTAAGELGDTSKLNGYVILADKGSGGFEVLAPLTKAEQEAKGCWPGERAQTKKLMDLLNKAHK